MALPANPYQRRPVAPAPGQPAPTGVLPMVGAPSVLTAQAPAQPGTLPQVGGSRTNPTYGGVPARAQPVTEFGPGNDLRTAQINPVGSKRQAAAGQMADVASQQLFNAPDRAALATGIYDNMLARSTEKIAKDAAAYGRLGSGMTAGAIDRESARIRADLAHEAAKSQMEDYLARQNALSGRESQLYGQEAGQREELRGERGYQYGMGRDAMGDKLNQAYLGMQGAQYLGQQAEGSQAAGSNVLQQLAMEEALRRQQGRRLPAANRIKVPGQKYEEAPVYNTDLNV